MVINDYVLYNEYFCPITWGQTYKEYLRQNDYLELTTYSERIYSKYGHTRNLLFQWK